MANFEFIIEYTIHTLYFIAVETSKKYLAESQSQKNLLTSHSLPTIQKKLFLLKVCENSTR